MRLWGCGPMRTSQRVRQIELILREDPRSYWASPDLQRELRELLAILHGGEHDEQFSDGGEPSAIEANDASSVVLAPK